MTYLLDTHVLIWMRENNPRLNRTRWEPVFHSPSNTICFSIVSIWEIAIKRKLGKLRMDGSTDDFARTLVTRHGFRQLPVELHEICLAERLPDHHRDPFDRLLIAQAIETGATAITDDTTWAAYPVKTDF